MNIAYLSLGSNIGNRLEHLTEAIRQLHEHPDITVTNASSVYETEPLGLTEQAKFLNIAIRLEASLEAERLLEVCQMIENRLGRMRKIRWGPRTVDLDILLFNDDIIQLEHLIIPHLRMQERAFVLVPLVEINPELQNPNTGTYYRDEPAVQGEGIVLWKQVNSVEELLTAE